MEERTEKSGWAPECNLTNTVLAVDTIALLVIAYIGATRISALDQRVCKLEEALKASEERCIKIETKLLTVHKKAHMTAKACDALSCEAMRQNDIDDLRLELQSILEASESGEVKKSVKRKEKKDAKRVIVKTKAKHSKKQLSSSSSDSSLTSEESDCGSLDEDTLEDINTRLNRSEKKDKKK